MRVIMTAYLLAVLCAIGVAPAAAQPAAAPAPAAKPPAAVQPKPPAAAPAPAAPAADQTGVEGFRSARFGQTEAQVRAAIKEDFKLNDAAIKVVTQPVEQTRMLTIVVRDLVAGSGEAQVTYVLGFRSKTLMLVNIQWNAPDTAGAELLTGVGTTLRDYFIAQSTRFVKEQTKANVSLPDGRNVLFHGADDKGRIVELLLTLHGKPAVQGQPADPRAASATLRLVYVLAPGNSDVQRIQPGQF